MRLIGRLRLNQLGSIGRRVVSERLIHGTEVESMSKLVEVFADVTCPFTHVGLRLVTARLRDHGSDAQILVRAWPLEWVNDAPLEADATAEKAAVLRERVAPELFAGFRVDRWPDSTVSALNLAALGYARDPGIGLQVSLALRDALFEDGKDISDTGVLDGLAARHGLPSPGEEPMPQVVADYSEGQARGVTGSPHFWIDGQNYFCPSLDIGRDEAGELTAELDASGLGRILSALSNGTAETR